MSWVVYYNIPMASRFSDRALVTGHSACFETEEEAIAFAVAKRLEGNTPVSVLKGAPSFLDTPLPENPIE